MHILVFGGTRFVGRSFVESAIARGHQLTLLNRGRSSPNLFTDLEQLHADRGEDLSVLDGRKFDAVFDTSGYFPRVVEMSAEKLKDSVGRYLFISSISVYKDASAKNQSEDAPLAETDETLPEEVTGETYAPLKVQCEHIVERVFGDRATIVRPGLIVGPHDTTDRFTYWPVRFSQPGPVLVPDVKDRPVQFIDVRDLGAWCLELLERGEQGAFNATGPQTPYRFEDVISACSAGRDADIVWVDPKRLDDEGVAAWTEMPLYLSSDSSSDGFMRINVDKAVAHGLKFRPLTETVADTRAWASTRPADYQPKAGLSPARELELLQKIGSNAG